jgi:hypothetical protein
MRRRASGTVHLAWQGLGMAFPSAFLHRTLRPWRDRPVDSRSSGNRDAKKFDFDCDSLLALLFRLTTRTHSAYYGFAPFVNMPMLNGDVLLHCLTLQLLQCLELFADDINFGAVVNPLVLVSLIQFRNVPIDAPPGAR